MREMTDMTNYTRVTSLFSFLIFTSSNGRAAMPSHQIIIMIRFLECGYYDNVARIKEMNEINKAKEEEKDEIHRKCESTSQLKFFRQNRKEIIKGWSL